MRDRFRYIQLSVILLCGVCGLYAQTSPLSAGARVVSPAEGTWANKQALILEVPEGCEAYYSFTGSDPRDFGFAYDGPVLLDATGSVPLRIVTVSPDGGTSERRIPFTVSERSGAWQPPVSDESPFVKYHPGDTIVFPSSFSYALGIEPSPFISNRSLSLEAGAFPARFVPCTVTDGSLYWRFVIVPDGTVRADTGINSPDSRTAAPADIAGSAGISAPADPNAEPPFTVTDWTTVTFTRKKLIYSLDGGDWAAASGSFLLDRSIPHRISWQSVAYDPSNPVYTAELPPKPLPPPNSAKAGNTPVVLAAENGYLLSPRGSALPPEPAITVDAFYGEELCVSVEFDAYYGGVRHGSLAYTVAIDKRPPAVPRFVSDGDSFYSRRPVSFSFAESADADIVYAVELTSEAATGFNELSLDAASIPAAPLSPSFTVYDGTRVSLPSRSGNASLYTVTAYSRDAAGNVSDPAVFRVIIDEFNYYLAADAVSDRPDGSLARPFFRIEQAYSVINDASFTRLHVNGMIAVPETVTVTGTCEINGAGDDSGFILAEGASFSVQDAARLYVNNCVFEKRQPAAAEANRSAAAAAAGKPLVAVRNAAVSFTNCELVAGFGSSGSVFTADSASVLLDNCGVTITSGRYAALFSGVRSNVSVTGGRFTAVAPTAVLFSLSAGIFDLTGSSCKVIADLGRIAELTGVTATLKRNAFAAELHGNSAAAARVSPVWYDGRSKLTADDGNTVSGFPGGLF